MWHLPENLRGEVPAYGLRFIPIREECYDLVIPERELDTAPVKPLLETLNARRFAVEISQLCAYDTKHMRQVSARNGQGSGTRNNTPKE